MYCNVLPFMMVNKHVMYVRRIDKVSRSSVVLLVLTIQTVGHARTAIKLNANNRQICNRIIHNEREDYYRLVPCILLH